MTSKLSERFALVGTIDPDAYVASTITSDWVDMGKFDRLMAVIYLGTLGASATIDAKLEQATDGSGTSAKDITGKAITQLTQAGTDASDNQAIIDVKADELDKTTNPDFDFVRLSITVAVATSDVGGAVYGGNARNKPASDNDLASVAEIVN